MLGIPAYPLIRIHREDGKHGEKAVFFLLPWPKPCDTLINGEGVEHEMEEYIYNSEYHIWVEVMDAEGEGKNGNESEDDKPIGRVVRHIFECGMMIMNFPKLQESVDVRDIGKCYAQDVWRDSPVREPSPVDEVPGDEDSDCRMRYCGHILQGAPLRS